MNRRRLPNRRAGETIGFEFRGAAYSATVLTLLRRKARRAFYRRCKAIKRRRGRCSRCCGGNVDRLAAWDTAEAIRAALTRDGAGRPAGILGAALDAIVAEAAPQ